MKALSIRQPWAWAILNAGKRIENRSWFTRYRGPVLIHASLHKPADDEMDAFRDILEDACSDRVLDRICHRDVWCDQPRGGIVGRAEIVDVVGDSKSVWFSGPYGLVLDGVKKLPFQPCKGRLGLFDIEMPAMEAADDR